MLLALLEEIRQGDPRAVTVKWPWSWAMAEGYKQVENRSQGTKHRGPLLIHSGGSISMRGWRDERIRNAWIGAGLPTKLLRRAPDGAPWDVVAAPDRLEARFGVVLAVAQLVDSHPDAGCCRPWGESEYEEASGRKVTQVHHLVLEDVVKLEPVLARGALGLWRPNGIVRVDVEDQLARMAA